MAGSAAAAQGQRPNSPPNPPAVPKPRAPGKPPTDLKASITKLERELMNQVVEDKRYKKFRNRHLDTMLDALVDLMPKPTKKSGRKATRRASTSSLDSQEEEEEEEDESEDEEDEEMKEKVKQAFREVSVEAFDKWSRDLSQICIEDWDADYVITSLKETSKRCEHFDEEQQKAHKNYMEELVILKTKMNELTRKTDRGEVIVEDEDLSFYEPTAYLSPATKEMCKEVIAYKVRLELMRGGEGQDNTPQLYNKIKHLEGETKALREQLEKARKALAEAEADLAAQKAVQRRPSTAVEEPPEVEAVRRVSLAPPPDVEVGRQEPARKRISVSTQGIQTDEAEKTLDRVPSRQGEPGNNDEATTKELEKLRKQLAKLQQELKEALLAAENARAAAAAAAQGLPPPPVKKLVSTKDSMTTDDLLQGLLASMMPKKKPSDPPTPVARASGGGGVDQAVVTRLEGEIAELLADKERLELDLAGARGEIKKLRARIEDLEDECQRLQGKEVAPREVVRTETKDRVVRVDSKETITKNRPRSAERRKGKQGGVSELQQYLKNRKRGVRVSEEIGDPMKILDVMHKSIFEVQKKLENQEMASLPPRDDDIVIWAEEMGSTMSKVCEYLGDIKGTVEQGLLDKEALAAAQALILKLQAENTALQMALEELKAKIEEMRAALRDAGMGDVADAVFEKIGLSSLLIPKKIKVFDRLYYDALERARRSGTGFSEFIRKHGGPELDAMLEAINKIYRPNHRKDKKSKDHLDQSMAGQEGQDEGPDLLTCQETFAPSFTGCCPQCGFSPRAHTPQEPRRPGQGQQRATTPLSPPRIDFPGTQQSYGQHVPQQSYMGTQHGLLPIPVEEVKNLITKRNPGVEKPGTPGLPMQKANSATHSGSWYHPFGVTGNSLLPEAADRPLTASQIYVKQERPAGIEPNSPQIPGRPSPSGMGGGIYPFPRRAPPALAKPPFPMSDGKGAEIWTLGGPQSPGLPHGSGKMGKSTGSVSAPSLRPGSRAGDHIQYLDTLAPCRTMSPPSIPRSRRGVQGGTWHPGGGTAHWQSASQNDTVTPLIISNNRGESNRQGSNGGALPPLDVRARSHSTHSNSLSPRDRPKEQWSRTSSPQGQRVQQGHSADRGRLGGPVVVQLGLGLASRESSQHSSLHKPGSAERKHGHGAELIQGELPVVLHARDLKSGSPSPQLGVRGRGAGVEHPKLVESAA